jgi:hypothetical protein
MEGFTRTILAAALASVAGLPHPAQALDACDASAEAAYRSCKSEAKSDKFLALGKCANLPNPAARTACTLQAAADGSDALQTCREQDALREVVCDRLGPAPYAPVIDPAHFVAGIDNPYYPLAPGTTFIYEGQIEEGFEHVEFAVTHATRVILGVTCIEIHDQRFLNGVLLEDTRDWFAQDDVGNVWYFGENTTLVDRGLPVNLGGTWTGGVDGAQPGLIMEAHPAIGDFYRQEFLLREAEDLAEVTSLSTPITVPYGSFPNALKTTESSPKAPGDVSDKFYAAGVGNLLTVEPNGDRSELVQIITE